MWKNYPVSERDIGIVLEQMKYILTDEEEDSVSSLSESQMKDFIEGFWEKLVPYTSFNVSKVVNEYFDRGKHRQKAKRNVSSTRVLTQTQ